MRLEDFRFKLGRGGEWSGVLTFSDIWGYEGEDCGVFTKPVAGVGKISGRAGSAKGGIFPGWEIEVVNTDEVRRRDYVSDEDCMDVLAAAKAAKEYDDPVSYSLDEVIETNGDGEILDDDG